LLTVSATRFKATYKATPGKSVTSTTTVVPLSSSGKKSSTISNETDKFPRTNPQRVGSDDVFRSNKRKFPVTMNPRLKLVVSLSALFIACTIMFPIAFFVDISENSSFHILGLRFSSAVLIQVYTLVCPLLLVRYMSSLKSALVGMGAALSRCCK